MSKESMSKTIKHFLDMRRSPVLSWDKKLLTRVQYKKKVVPFVKNIPKRLMGIFAENIYGIWLMKRWLSILGYLLLLLVVLAMVIVADHFETTRPFIHSANANEIIIGVFTILLTLMIPLAIALLQSDSDVDFVRQAIVKTVIRFKWTSIVLGLICVSLFIPSGIHIAGESLTLKNLYIPVLACCMVFMSFSFYRSIRWLGDESSRGFDGSVDGNIESYPYGFSSYRFAQIMRLLQDASPQTWMAIWTQRFPIGYEDTIQEAFFKRIETVVDGKRRKQYRSISFELQSYNANFDNRNKLGYKFEYQNPERFFSLFGKVEEILHEDYVDSRLDGLWQGRDALKNISNKIIDSLMDSHRVWSLFQAMNKYVIARDLLEIKSGKIKDDELVRDFLYSAFNAIKNGKISAHDALAGIKDESGWTVTYDHLYGKQRYNLSFLTERLYRKWLNDLLDKATDESYFLFNDSIAEYIFPGTDTIMMGKLYWLLHLAGSSDYLNLWIKEHRPIGLVNLSGGFEVAGERTEEEMLKEFRKRADAQELDTVKLFCSRYFGYLHTDLMKLSENLDIARSMDRKSLSKVEVDRLDDFIRIVELIEEFYKTTDKERKKPSKSKRAK